ncbi:hypothetical protein ATO1_05435 [Phaeobacter sp. 22II1-1F12B]|nr:hypothetical protein ATO1_05435 [Phaeobacter sp. 22II1-1F12B]
MHIVVIRVEQAAKRQHWQVSAKFEQIGKKPPRCKDMSFNAMLTTEVVQPHFRAGLHVKAVASEMLETMQVK